MIFPLYLPAEQQNKKHSYIFDTLFYEKRQLSRHMQFKVLRTFGLLKEIRTSSVINQNKI